MKIWRDKDGKMIDAKEFKERFNQGLQSVTPLQQTYSIQFGTFIILIGIIIGIITSIITKIYWLTTVLSGALIVNGVSFLGNWQRIRALKKVEEMMKQSVQENVPEYVQ